MELNRRAPERVFVDSDAFVALAKNDDSNHARAERTLEQLREAQVQFLSSNYVFAETITVISQRMGREQALSFIRVMKSPESAFPFRWIQEDIEQLALDIFKQQRSKNASFVDCTNIAIVRHDRLDAIFSFDSIYRKNGIPDAESVL